MALTSNQLGVSEAANFIPQLWSDEVIATYKKNLVLANLVTKISHKGKKGDTINIPAPDRKAASQKATDTSVTLIAHTDSNVAVSINRHFEYSVLIEDIAEVQALSSMRKFHTDDAGYALATRVDTDLAEVASNLNNGSGVSGNAGWDKAQVWNATTGVLTDWLRSGSGNASSLSAAGNELAIRAMIEKLDLQDIPMDNRAFVLTPRQYSDILGVSRFTEQQFIGSGDAIKTGKVGMIYGVDIFVTNNLDTTQNATTPADHDLGLLIHKEALVCAEQVGVRTQTQYKQEYLGDLFTADTLYGVKEMRDNAGFAFVTTR